MNPRDSIKNCIDPANISGALTMGELGVDTVELIMELENKSDGKFDWICDATTVIEIDSAVL